MFYHSIAKSVTDGSVTRVRERHRQWLVAAIAVLVLLAVRLPFLAPTLEDVDSVNFDLGVHSYNPAAHRPHPPGYPVYILLATASHSIVSDHATALAVLAALFSSLSVVPLYFLLRELTTPAGAAIACLFTLFSPLVWFNSVRPMNDLVGFFAAISVQLALLKSRVEKPVLWYMSAALAGIAVGIRFQTLFLTVPVLCYVAVRQRARWSFTMLAFGAGVAAWMIPLVYFMGGPVSAAMTFAPVVHDTVNADSLIPQWTLYSAIFAGRDFLVAPWQHPMLAAGLLLLAGAGAIVLALAEPRRLVLPLLLFLPYTVFHYVFQDAETLRYTIPAIPLVAFLASVPLTRWRCRTLIIPLAAVGFGGAAAAITLPALEEYHSTASPMMQAVTTLSQRAASERVVISGHFTFERYLPLLPQRFERLALTHQKEWQSLTEYWRSGRREPVLFLRETHRTDLLQFGRDTQHTLGRWEWPALARPFLKGARPGSIELVRLEPPRWAIESGAFVTDEAGPYEEVKRQPHRFYVRPSPSPQVLMVSGAVDAARGPVELSLENGVRVSSFSRADGLFTVRALLPPITSESYVPISLHAPAPVAITDVWLEGETRAAVRPAAGFYLAERDAGARLFRWMGVEARAAAYLPTESGRLTIEGWIPVNYYRLPLTLSLAWNGRPLASFRVDSERFRHRLRMERASESAWGELTISSSHSFVPDERVRNGDLRRLSIRIYELGLEAVRE